MRRAAGEQDGLVRFIRAMHTMLGSMLRRWPTHVVLQHLGAGYTMSSFIHLLRLHPLTLSGTRAAGLSRASWCSRPRDDVLRCWTPCYEWRGLYIAVSNSLDRCVEAAWPSSVAGVSASRRWLFRGCLRTCVAYMIRRVIIRVVAVV